MGGGFLTRTRNTIRLGRFAMSGRAREWQALLSVVLFLGAAVGCSDSTPTTPSALQVALRGEVTDPAGDSPFDPRVPVSSDLVNATAEVASGSVTFTVRLAPGTLDRQTTRVVILLDTDQSASTGIR